MLEFFCDPKSYWPFPVLLFLSFSFAFVGAHAVFHPGQPLSQRGAFAVQVAALVSMAVVWGYISFSFGLLSSVSSPLFAWVACCAGSAAGRSQRAAVGRLGLSLEADLTPAAREDIGA